MLSPQLNLQWIMTQLLLQWSALCWSLLQPWYIVNQDEDKYRKFLLQVFDIKK